MPKPLFDPLVHEPSRLQICGLLAPVIGATFATVREETGLSDSALSKHLRALEEAGYLEIRKERVGGRTYTAVGLTESGRYAFCGHMAELQRLAGVASVRRRPQRVVLDRSPSLAATRPRANAAS
jgi:DNA-binding transcriptional ArsR family regulator